MGLLFNYLFLKSINVYVHRQVGELSTGGKKECISVATLTEAEYFARGGFEDILCTALFTADKIDR